MTIAESLRAKNLRVTPQREAIAEILQDHGHLTVDNLYSLIKETHPAISLATVYKNIKDMVEKNFLMEVAIPNQKSLFELNKNAHIHTFCRCCGSITDITIDPLKLAENIPTQLEKQFSTDTVQLTLHGICSKCKG